MPRIGGTLGTCLLPGVPQVTSSTGEKGFYASGDV
jgi:hypothetical protein